MRLDGATIHIEVTGSEARALGEARLWPSIASLT